MKLEKILARAALGFGLAFGTMSCGPDDPVENPDAGVCCETADAGTSNNQDGGPDAGPVDAGYDAGPADSGATCTTTPAISYVTTLTPNGTINSYKAKVGESFTIDACATTGAERFEVAYWNENDGASDVSTECQKNLSYTTPGMRTINVRAYNDSCSTSATKAIEVMVEQANQPPVANAGLDMTIAAQALSYCFNFSDNSDSALAVCGSNPRWAPGHGPNGTGSYDLDGTIKEYWALQDKSIPEEFAHGSFSGKIKLVYNTPGQFTLLLKVIDDKGAESTDEALINVTP